MMYEYQVHWCLQIPKLLARKRGFGGERGIVGRQYHSVGEATYHEQGLVIPLYCFSSQFWYFLDGGSLARRVAPYAGLGCP